MHAIGHTEPSAGHEGWTSYPFVSQGCSPSTQPIRILNKEMNEKFFFVGWKSFTVDVTFELVFKDEQEEEVIGMEPPGRRNSKREGLEQRKPPR